MKTLKIAERTHTELTKIKGEIMAETGNPKLSYDEVIESLIENWKTTKHKEGDVNGS